MDFQFLFKDISVAGISLIALIIGLVQFIKGLGVSGVYIKVVAFLIGATLGGGYHVSIHGAPNDMASWLTAVVVALAFGIGAPSFYDAAFRNKES